MSDETTSGLPIEQRRLLAISRMVFDGIAEGHPFTRDEAADLAQRIVDEIGHSVTDEPALGPSFRVEIERLQDLISRMRADYRAEIAEAEEQITYAQRIDEAIEPPEQDHVSEDEFAAIICATMRKHRAEVHPEHAEGCGNCAVIKGAPEVLTYGLDRSDLPAVRAFAAELDPRREAT